MIDYQKIEFKCELNLFKLHDVEEDKNPYSWIKFYGSNLRNLVNSIINEILNKNKISKAELAVIISKKLGCSTSHIKSIVFVDEWFPIPFLNALIDLWKDTSNIEEYKNLRTKIQNSIEEVTCLRDYLGPFKACKNIDETLCKIIGAHLADGTMVLSLKFWSKCLDKLESFKNEFISNFSTVDKPEIRESTFKGRTFYFEIWPSVDLYNQIKCFISSSDFIKSSSIRVLRSYQFSIRDEYKNSLDSFSNWMQQVFGLKLKVIKTRTEDSWNISFKNKIFFRYLNKVFGIPFGNKTKTVDVPKLIKKLGFTYRKALCIGLFTFDGSMELAGHVELNLTNHKLIDFVCKVLQEDNLLFLKGERGGHYYCKSNRLYANLKDSDRWISYFETGTEKWLRATESSYGFKHSVQNKNDALKCFNLAYGKYTNLIEIIKTTENLNEFEMKDICTKMKISKMMACTYIRILKNSNIINLQFKGSEYGGPKRIYNYNPNVNEWLVPKRTNGV